MLNLFDRTFKNAAHKENAVWFPPEERCAQRKCSLVPARAAGPSVASIACAYARASGPPWSSGSCSDTDAAHARCPAASSRAYLRRSRTFRVAAAVDGDAARALADGSAIVEGGSRPRRGVLRGYSEGG